MDKISHQRAALLCLVLIEDDGGHIEHFKHGSMAKQHPLYQVTTPSKSALRGVQLTTIRASSTASWL